MPWSAAAPRCRPVAALVDRVQRRRDDPCGYREACESTRTEQRSGSETCLAPRPFRLPWTGGSALPRRRRPPPPSRITGRVGCSGPGGSTGAGAATVMSCGSANFRSNSSISLPVDLVNSVPLLRCAARVSTGMTRATPIRCHPVAGPSELSSHACRARPRNSRLPTCLGKQAIPNRRSTKRSRYTPADVGVGQPSAGGSYGELARCRPTRPAGGSWRVLPDAGDHAATARSPITGSAGCAGRRTIPGQRVSRGGSGYRAPDSIVGGMSDPCR